LSLALRKVHRLKVVENRLLRRIFGPKSDEMKGGWRKLYNKESSIIRITKSRRVRWTGDAAGMAKKRNA
jgi:hypothetical protein